MNKRTFLLTLTVSLLLPLGAAGSAIGGEPGGLPVKKVVLFNSGVGYFQHGGTISGGESVRLPFSREQINDVLKSLVVENLDGTRPGSVLYPSRNPQERILSEFQIHLGHNPPFADILNQLRGTAVRTTLHGEMITGALVNAEQRPLSLPGVETPVMDWVITLNTEAGLRVLPLRELGAVALLDEAVRASLGGALAALDHDRVREQKQVAIQFPGQGDKRVRVGYVLETPVWKTSYRLVLPDVQETKAGPYLQGWAIVENQSDNDWNEVRLSLVSGRPISFVQDLYQPLYRQRPEVGVRAEEGVAPRQYGRGANVAAAPPPDARQERMRQKSHAALSGDGALLAAPGAMQAEVMAAGVEEGRGGEADAAARNHTGWAGHDLLPQGADVATAATGALFQFIVEGVSLPKRQAAMIPIVSDPVAVKRVGIYNRAALSDHPLHGVQLKNTTGKDLPAGPVTLYDGGLYGGDALLGELPAGQEGILAYAVDIETKISVFDDKSDERVVVGRIVNGLLTLTRRHEAQKRYVLDNRGGAERVILVEHPVRVGWQLSGPEKPVATAGGHYRFQKTVPPGQVETLVVVEERVLEQRLSLLSGRSELLFDHVRQGGISQAVRKSLEQVAVMRQKMEESRQTIQETEARLVELRREQQRIHENLRAVASGSSFHNRMLAKLDSQESLIEQLQIEMVSLRTRLQGQRRALEKQLSNLTVE